MILLLLLLPTLTGVCCLFLRADEARRNVLVSTAIAHTAVTVSTWWTLPAAHLDGWLLLDAPGRVFLSITSLLFLTVAVYSLGYLRRESDVIRTDIEEGPCSRMHRKRRSRDVCCCFWHQ